MVLLHEAESTFLICMFIFRYTDGHWVFGGIERITGKSFLVEVAQRDAATLIPIIKDHIRPGSIIYSDEWRAYRGIPTIPGYNYQHRTVNHSQNFVDPSSGKHILITSSR